MTVDLSLNSNNFWCCSVSDFRQDFFVADIDYAQMICGWYKIDLILYISSLT